MADKNTIKNWFRTNLKPTQAQFWATWDSFWHKDEKIPITAIDNIENILADKADAEVLAHHLTDLTAHADLFDAKEDKTKRGAALGYAPLNEFTKLAIDYLNVVNDLVTGGESSLLTAEQGKLLQIQITAINTLLTSNDINLDTVQEIVDAIKTVETSLESILINDLTTGGATKALTAEMGKILKGLIDGLANNKADNSNVVHLAGEEIIDGFKTFNSDLKVNLITVGKGGSNIESNTAIGYESLLANTTGFRNSANGFNALKANTQGFSNTAGGFLALASNTNGYRNTANGTESLYLNTTGVDNTAIGAEALKLNSTGSSNLAIGVMALLENTIGCNNVATGVKSLSSLNSGNNNVGIGMNSGNSIADKSTAISTMSNSVFIGYRTSPLADNQTNQIVIGNDATGLGSNTSVLGNSLTVFSRVWGRNLIGTSIDNGVDDLQVNGTASFSPATLSNQGVVKSQLDLKADIASPTFTGIPTTPTAAAGTNTTQIATTEFVSATDANNVKLTGNQTIGGFKTFNNDINISGGGQQFKINAPNGSVAAYSFANAVKTTQWTLETDTGQTGQQGEFRIRNQITLGNPIRITTNNEINLGGALFGTNANFSGVITAPTATAGTNTTQLATTAFVLANGFSIPHLEFNNTNKTVWNNGNGNVVSNTSFGEFSMANSTTGSTNTAIGYNSLRFNTTGTSNTANGASSLFSNTTGISNTATGSSSLLFNSSGSGNTANGASSLQSNTTGISNTATGSSSLFSNTTGSTNTANGSNSLRLNTTGNNNTANGFQSLLNNKTGNNNTAIGLLSGSVFNVNTPLINPNNSLFIGSNTRSFSDNQINEIVIGESATGLGSNTSVLGNSLTVFSRVWGRNLIGTSIDNGVDDLQVVGSAKFTSSVQVGDNALTASSSNVGAIRYRATANSSFSEMCMQTGATAYEWKIQTQNNW